MSDQTSTTKLSLYAYAVREVGDKSHFTKIGVVFDHARGKGMNIELSALPIDSRIVLFPPKENQTEPTTP